MEVLQTGLTYKEHLQAVRARQFGWDIEEPTPITEGSTVKAEEAPKKKTTKKATKVDE